MRAVVYDRYGPAEVQRLEEVAQPIPRDDELLISVHATTVNRADCATREANRRSGPAVMLLSRSISGLRRPRQRILGSELAGEVVAVGAAVTDFTVGDRVFGDSGFRFGAHAEYMRMRASALVAQMPANLRFEEAAVCDGALNALWCLRGGGLRQGQRVLIFGASGSIGTAGVQLAKSFGADVTGCAAARTLSWYARLAPTG
jgi:NADPH:quinone reductase-like Zn-dependent oxidoreductase